MPHFNKRTEPSRAKRLEPKLQGDITGPTFAFNNYGQPLNTSGKPIARKYPNYSIVNKAPSSITITRLQFELKGPSLDNLAFYKKVQYSNKENKLRNMT